MKYFPVSKDKKVICVGKSIRYNSDTKRFTVFADNKIIICKSLKQLKGIEK